MSTFTVYECRNCLEHLRVSQSQAGYPLRCPLCGRTEFRIVPTAAAEEHDA